MTVNLQWATPEIDKQIKDAELKMTNAEAIRFAYKKGCRFDFETQELITHTGLRVKPKIYGRQRYAAYTIATFKKNKVSFHLHKFAAYQLYGDEALKSGIHVRHLDGNRLNNSKSNLALGTASQNESDKDPEARIRVAKIARQKQIEMGIKSPNAKLTDRQVEILLSEYLKVKVAGKKMPNGYIPKKAKELGLSISGIQAILRGKNRKDIFLRVINEQR